MAKQMEVRLDHADPNIAIVTLSARDSGAVMGKTLQIEIGRSVLLNMPDFLMEGQAEDASEDKDYRIDQLKKRIGQLEEEKQAALKPSDETDIHLINTLRENNDRLNEKAKALATIMETAETDYKHTLDKLRVKELDRLLKDASLPLEGKKDDKISTLVDSFNDEDEEEKLHMLMSAKANEADLRAREAASTSMEERAEANRDSVNEDAEPAGGKSEEGRARDAEVKEQKESEAKSEDEQAEEREENKDKARETKNSSDSRGSTQKAREAAEESADDAQRAADSAQESKSKAQEADEESKEDK